MRRTRRVRLDIGLMALLLGASVAVWVGRDQLSANMIALVAPSETAKTRIPPAPVIVARVGRETDSSIVESIGTARARRAVMLMPKAAGQIVRLNVEPGSRVKAGSPVFTIDETQAKLAVTVAKQQLADARRALDRILFLSQRRISPQAAVDDQRSAVIQAEIALAQAEAPLKDLTVVAPFDGVVGIPKAEVGDRVETSTQVVSVDDRAELIVEFQVPERFLPRVAVGDGLSVTTPAYRDRSFAGTIKAIDSRIDPQSRFFMVRAGIPNADDALRPGMSFHVNLEIGGPAYPSVPELALQWRDGSSFIWTVRDKKAQRINVSVVKRLSDRVLVDASALRTGMLVVVEGVHRLQPNRAVAFAAPVPAPTSDVGDAMTQPGPSARNTEPDGARPAGGPAGG